MCPSVSRSLHGWRARGGGFGRVGEGDRCRPVVSLPFLLPPHHTQDVCTTSSLFAPPPFMFVRPSMKMDGRCGGSEQLAGRGMLVHATLMRIDVILFFFCCLHAGVERREKERERERERGRASKKKRKRKRRQSLTPLLEELSQERTTKGDEREETRCGCLDSGESGRSEFNQPDATTYYFGHSPRRG